MLRKIIWTFVLITFIIGGVMLINMEGNTLKADGEAALGQIAYTIGAVRVATESNPSGSNAYNGQIVYNTNVVMTASDGKAVVDLGTGSFLALNTNSVVQLRGSAISAGGNNNQTTFNVVRGSARIAVSRQQALSGLNVSTPSTHCGVRGTEFLVGVADTGASNVVVLEGEVAVLGSETNQSNPQIVTRGMNASTDLNASPAVQANQGEVRDFNAGEYRFGASTDMRDWAIEEQSEAAENPNGTLVSMTTRLDGVEVETSTLVDVVQTETQQIAQGAQQGETELSQQQLQQLRDVDTRVVSASCQNYAIEQLAARTRDNNQGNAQIQNQYNQVQQRVDRIDQMEASMDRFIADMEAQINAMIEAQMEAIDEMVPGGWDQYFNDY